MKATKPLEKLGTVVRLKPVKNPWDNFTTQQCPVLGVIYKFDNRGQPRRGMPPRNVTHVLWVSGHTSWFWSHLAHKKLDVVEAS